MFSRILANILDTLDHKFLVLRSFRLQRYMMVGHLPVAPKGFISIHTSYTQPHHQGPGSRSEIEFQIKKETETRYPMCPKNEADEVQK